MTSKLRVWALSILCAAVLGGCEEKKDEAKKDEGAKTTASGTATSGATSTPTAGGATTGGVTTPAAVGGAASTASGDLFKYMPADCPMGRIYVNQAALFTPEMTATFQQLQEKMFAAGNANDPKATAALKVLKDGGVDQTSLREAAMCLNKDESKMVIAIAIDPAKISDPLGLASKVYEAAGKPAPEKGDAGGVPYIKLGADNKGVLAMVQPNVAILVEKPEMIATAKAGGGAAAFADAAKQAIFVDIEPEPNSRITAQLTDKGATYDGRVGIKLPAAQADVMKKNPDEFVKKFKEQTDKMAEKFAQGPLKVVGDKLKAVAYKVEGDLLVATVSITKAELNDFVKTVGAMDPKELMKTMR
jgi:hypothetical protein